MRIGLNALYWIPDAMGGTQTYLLKLVEALRRIAPEHDYVVFLNSEGAARQAPELADLETDVCPLSGRTRFMRVLWEHTILPERVNTRRLDVLHSPGYIGPIRLAVPSVVTVIDLVHYRFPRQIAPAKRLLWRWLFPRSLAAAREIITISSTVAAELGDRFPFTRTNTTAVPLGVATQWLAPPGAPAASAPYLLSVASAAPHKNLATLLRALARLAPFMPNLTLQLVGMHTPTTDVLMREASRLGIDDRVRFTGRVNDAELGALYRGAAAFVFPSLYEGFGLPLLEAMAAGCPVIASDRTIVREVAGDSAILFSPEDDAALAEAVTRLLHNADLRQQLQRRGRARALNASWERTASGTLSVYQRAATAGGLRA